MLLTLLNKQWLEALPLLTDISIKYKRKGSALNLPSVAEKYWPNTQQHGFHLIQMPFILFSSLYSWSSILQLLLSISRKHNWFLPDSDSFELFVVYELLLSIVVHLYSHRQQFYNSVNIFVNFLILVFQCISAILEPVLHRWIVTCL